MPEHNHYNLYEKFLFTKITHTRKVQNFEVMSNNFQVQETYSKFEAHVTNCHTYTFFSAWLSMPSRDDVTKYAQTTAYRQLTTAPLYSSIYN
jgi:hypothetical protein